MNNGLILVCEKLTARDIPLLTQYNPFVISKDPISDQDVIRAMKKKKIRGISGVNTLSNLQVTIGNEPICINGAVPIAQIAAALSGKLQIKAVQNLDNEEEEEDIEEETDNPTDGSSDPLCQKLEEMQKAIEALTEELKRRERQVIIREDTASSQHVCNADVFKLLETGFYSNVG